MPFVKGRAKTGGRAAGVPNKKTVKRQQIIENLKASGKDPLSFFGDILSNEEAPFSVRFDAAKEMLPYMHPRLASIESRRGGMTHEERLEKARQMLARKEQLSMTRSQAVDLVPIDGSHTPTPGGRVSSEQEGGD